MVDVDALIDRLRRRGLLSEQTTLKVDAALRDGRHAPDEILLQAGLSLDQVRALLDRSEDDAPDHTVAEETTTVTTVTDEPSVDDLIARLVNMTPRFQLQGEIARGAMGRILAAWDLHLGRPVAIKILRKASARDLDRARFLEEAQVTGQLQHPSIMPVYELGRLRDQVAFVMRRIEGRSLKDVISGLRRGDPETERSYGRMRLLNIFHQLCLAVAYAHTRQVVHRDLKPSNVMLGDFGEVVLLDWGLCKIIGAATRSTRSTSERWKTVHGQIIGTPAYMAPEQAMGLIDQVDQRTDVYGLGAILYHLLTLRPPFSGKSNREIVNRVLKERVRPPSERAPDRDIPGDLEEICLRCLAQKQAQRYPNARALAEAIRRVLDAPGTGTAAISRVDNLVRRGVAAMTRQDSLLEDAALITDELNTARATLDPDDQLGSKAAAWEAVARLEEVQAETADVIAQAMHALGAAVAIDPDHHQARKLLCDLYVARHEFHLARGDEGGMAFFRRLLAEHDTGRYAQLVAGEGSLHVEISPAGAHLWLWRFDRQQQRLVAGHRQELGPAPVKVEQMPAGIYQLAAQAAGRETLTTTVVVEPGRCARLRLRMLRAGAVPEGYVHIPAGTFRFGSPRHPFLGPTEQALPDVLVGSHPVTAGQYLEFIRTLAAARPEEAAGRLPRTHDGRGWLWGVDAQGYYQLPERDGWTPDLPIVGITADDAVAYCRWRSDAEGATVRLPTEEEWEKAARGTEGRSFPWGPGWEPAYAACPATWPGPWPPPVGYAGYDCSPFGVCDLAGGVREWTATAAPGRTPRQIVRGGSFLTGDEEGRPLWTRELVRADFAAPDIGFRVARDPLP